MKPRTFLSYCYLHLRIWFRRNERFNRKHWVDMGW
jgi:hypothetical protein